MCIGRRLFEELRLYLCCERLHSDSLQRVMDEESLKLVNSAYETVLALLQENRQKLEKIAHELLTHEILSNKQLNELIGPKMRPS